MEGAPTPCYLGNTYGGAGGYMQIHNPFMYFHSTSAPGQKCNNVVPFTSFAGDLNSPSPPAFVWVTPTGCHQMHDSCAPLNDPVKQGDQWLKSTMQTVLASSWYAQGGTVIITWDEGTNSQGWNCPNGCGGNTSNGGGQIPTVVVSSGANGQISDGGNHYGTLRSIAKAYGVPFLVPTADGDAANGDLLAGLARSTTTSLAASPNPSTSSQTVSLTATVSASGGGIPSGTVTFRDGSQSLGSVGLDPSGTAQLASSSLSVGSHPLTAAYQGASGFISSTSPQVTQVVQTPPPPPPSPSPGPRSGYRMVASDGGIFSFGGAAFYGSKGGTPLNKPIVGLAVTPSGRGYWMVASDGGIFAFGDAGFYGSMGGTRLNQPVVNMAASSTGGGYWLVAADGGIFTFGDSPFLGSMGGVHLNRPVVGMAAIPLSPVHR